jgi:hypothetical protein
MPTHNLIQGRRSCDIQNQLKNLFFEKRQPEYIYIYIGLSLICLYETDS